MVCLKGSTEKVGIPKPFMLFTLVMPMSAVNRYWTVLSEDLTSD